MRSTAERAFHYGLASGVLPCVHVLVMPWLWWWQRQAPRQPGDDAWRRRFGALLAADAALIALVSIAVAQLAEAEHVVAPQPQRIGITSDSEFGGPGVRVAAVHEGSPASSAGLRRGDVIEGIDGEPLADLAALKQALSAGTQTQARVLEVRRAAALFGLWHYETHGLSALLICGGGWVLGWAYLRSGRLTVSIALHAAMNTSWFLLGWLRAS